MAVFTLMSVNTNIERAGINYAIKGRAISLGIPVLVVQKEIYVGSLRETKEINERPGHGLYITLKVSM